MRTKIIKYSSRVNLNIYDTASIRIWAANKMKKKWIDRSAMNAMSKPRAILLWFAYPSSVNVHVLTARPHPQVVMSVDVNPDSVFKLSNNFKSSIFTFSSNLQNYYLFLFLLNITCLINLFSYTFYYRMIRIIL